MMRLLITTQSVDRNDPILGFFHGWLLEFAKHFEQIHVICLREGEHALPSNVHVYSLGKESGENKLKFLLRFYTFFSKIFLFGHVDFVFFHMGAIYNILAFPFFLVRSIKKTRFLWWKTHGLLNRVGKMALFCVDEVVTAGSYSFNGVMQKVRVVGHAVDTNMFTIRTHAGRRDAFRVLSVGRVVPIKKIEIAIDAVQKFQNLHQCVIHLSIIGPATDALYSGILEKQIATNSLESAVSFLGPVSPHEMCTMYGEYDVLIHPAYEAGFDKVVLEAMASGVIPITSIQSFRPILEPLGLFVAPGDSDGYAHTLSRMYRMHDEEREKMRNTLRAIVVESHSIETLPERIFGVV